jgi:aspartokinase/homoserine dehydrogenase 1
VETSDSRWKIHKFGGSSVADAPCMARVADILEVDPCPRLAVVLSACRGVTDLLLGLVNLAEDPGRATGADLDALRDRHAAIARALLTGADAEEFIAGLDSDVRDIAAILQAVGLIRVASSPIRDVVAGYGELWSSRLFTRCLRARTRRPGPVEWVDARDVIHIEWTTLGPSVRWDQSRANIAQLSGRSAPATLIIPGFVARDPHGLQTTLGRNGSDFSASILGKLLDAGEIVIWTDVDGVLSADPRRVPGATVIEALSYEEAMELAYFGAKVIHPQTMAPAIERGIPIRIRNTFAPERAGSVIHRQRSANHAVKGITSIERIALVNIEGAGMIGVPGTAERLFGALREGGISVILISQGSSEHSICFAVPMAEAARAEQIVARAFSAELARGQLQKVELTPDCSILSVVGDGMAGTPGVAAKVFGSLGSSGVNVRAIAQGSSERNISVVIDEPLTTRALRSVHSSFYLSPHTVSIGLIGPGLVGRAFLDQLASQLTRLHESANLDLRVRGIANSKRMLLADPMCRLDHWREALDSAGPVDLSGFEEHVHSDHLPHAVIVDCSASATVAACYPRWLDAGIHVVTPNKKANSADLAFYAELRHAWRRGGAHYLYEATVGAGLPIIQTLRDLRDTGDQIQRIEGMLSGTLSYLFSTWDGTRPFSAVVRDAKASGYTEPDPRDDLSGMDVARKLIILAREMGVRLELADVCVVGLVPDRLKDCDTPTFLERVSELDELMQRRLDDARRRGRVLRYVGALDAATGRATVALEDFEPTHPFANVNPTDNVVRFITSRYDRNPLVVQGPGAGPAVTAAGVFADLLRVCAYLGARL